MNDPFREQISRVGLAQAAQILISSDTTAWESVPVENFGNFHIESYEPTDTTGDFVRLGAVVEQLIGLFERGARMSDAFEQSSQLRCEGEDPDDLMGIDSDPGAMGAAETWFRKLRSGGEV